MNLQLAALPKRAALGGADEAGVATARMIGRATLGPAQATLNTDSAVEKVAIVRRPWRFSKKNAGLFFL